MDEVREMAEVREMVEVRRHHLQTLLRLVAGGASSGSITWLLQGRT